MLSGRRFRFVPVRGGIVALGAVVLLAAAGAAWRHVGTGSGGRVGGSTCGTRVGDEPRVYRHVVWVVLENESYDDVVGQEDAPFLNGLAANCGLATSYFAVAHPSLPNYLAMTSGSTWGIADDDLPSAHPLDEPSLFSQLGGDWRALLESMPSPCLLTNDGRYAARHNPAAYFVDVRQACDRQESSGAPDARARFTLIVPNLCHDGHDCPIATADHWLAQALRPLLDGDAYRDGGTALFIVWDEADEAGSNQIPAIVVSPYTAAGTRSATRFDHYSLLRTTESMLGLPCLAAACQASSMRAAFGL
jgi:hypothetical protein